MKKGLIYYYSELYIEKYDMECQSSIFIIFFPMHPRGKTVEYFKIEMESDVTFPWKCLACFFPFKLLVYLLS